MSASRQPIPRQSVAPRTRHCTLSCHRAMRESAEPDGDVRYAVRTSDAKYTTPCTLQRENMLCHTSDTRLSCHTSDAGIYHIPCHSRAYAAVAPSGRAVERRMINDLSVVLRLTMNHDDF